MDIEKPTLSLDSLISIQNIISVPTYAYADIETMAGIKGELNAIMDYYKQTVPDEVNAKLNPQQKQDNTQDNSLQQ